MNFDETLVSVMIPAYNHEKYVQETIRSIIAQTHKNIELLVVDDGSTDSTWKKINEMRDECEKRFSRVVFETKQNEGTCDTLNRLLSLSKGEYVYIIASDDMAKPQAIEKELRFLAENLEYALAVGDNEIIDANGRRCFWDEEQNCVYDEKLAKYKTFGEFLSKAQNFDLTSDRFGAYHKLYVSNHIPNGYLIRKSIFEKTGLWTNEAPLEDYYMMLQIAKYARMKFLDEILFSYRWHDRNTIVAKRDEIVEFDKKTREYEEKILKNFENLQIVILTEKYSRVLNEIVALKNSRTMKAGQIVTKPFKILRNVFRRIFKFLHIQ